MRPRQYLLVSTAVAVATIALKTGAWWVSGSVSLLSDALESGVNLAGALFALLMVTLAAQPADEEHPYGHHKAEYFSGGFEGLLILGAAVAMALAAVQRLLAPQPLEAVGLGLGLSVASSLLNGGLGLAMARAGRAQRSVALEAGGRHLITDVWTSAGVVLGLLGAQATGWAWLDPVMALALAVWVGLEGVRLVRSAVDGLMDRALDADERRAIDTVLAGFADPALRFDHLHTRRAGSRRYVDLHLHMPANWSLGHAAALRTRVEQALMGAVPGLRASIQLLPTDVEAHLDDPKDLR